MGKQRNPFSRRGPDLDAKSVVQIIQQGCDDIGAQGYDIYPGHGQVHFGKSVKLARDWKTQAGAERK